jgi:hypothetical protein
MLLLKRRTILYAAPLVFFAAVSSAQIPDQPDLTPMRVKLGPVYLNPTLALTNAGVDTNVFNVADDQGPQKDFTVTIEPKTVLWMRAGRTWVNGNITEDIVWFKKFASERSANNKYEVNWLIPLTRVAFEVGANKVSTRDRPGYEIDARSQQRNHDFNGAMEVRGLSKTFFGVKVDRATTSFDQDQFFLGTALDDLDRTVTTTTVSIRNQLTPLTNFTFNAAREQDRFSVDPLRNSNSNSVSAGLKFDQLALVKGGVLFGWRDFQPVISTEPGFKGLTSSVDLSYVLLSTTRFAFGTTRDVQYSYDINQPYYVQTAFTASMTQQVFGPFDLQGRIGAARLAYVTRTDAVVTDPNRVDHTRTYGLGVGYHMGQDLRLAFNLDQVKRLSELDFRTYHGLRYGTALTYGF